VITPLGSGTLSSPVTGTATLTADQIKDMAAGKYYVNVHTAANKGGEIRGQVLHGKLPKPKAAKTTS
jgi:hypothetical protein